VPVTWWLAGATVCKLLDAKGQGPPVAEWELNALVYDLYGLTEEEIPVIERH